MILEFKFTMRHVSLWLLCGLGCAMQMAVAMELSREGVHRRSQSDPLETRQGAVRQNQSFPSSAITPPCAMLTQTDSLQNISISAARDPLCSPRYNASDSPLLIVDWRDGLKGHNFSQDDDIFRECCCVKDCCMLCGTAAVIAGFAWLKKVMDPVQ